MIYYDTGFTKNHNPQFGSLECGDRVKIDLDWYISNGYKIITPNISSKYLNILADLHKNNPVINYLSSDPFSKGLIRKILVLNNPKMRERNCHGCTMYTSDDECHYCKTPRDPHHFYKYLHHIDKNIVDSDTTYLTDTTYIAIKNAVTLVCQMVDSGKNGFAIIRPPGHHATADCSQGFCLVNNVAIAAKYAITQKYQKIFIFDFDAHHGNGTQTIFYDDPKVYYCSIHTAMAYPKTGGENEIGTGAGYGYNLNIVVPQGISSQDYIKIFYSKVIPAIKNYGPELILVSAGFDGLATDPMIIMKLEPYCYGLITKALVDTGVPVMMILEGGYDLDNITECIKICVCELNMK